MKKKIISLFGLILAAGVFTYAAVLKSSSEPATLENGDYYLYNVASGKWLGGGNSWGTQASLLKHANYFTLAKVEDGVYTLDSHISNGGDSHFLGNGGFVDATAANWQIQKNGENYVLTLGDGKYIGWDGESTVLKTDIEDVASANAQWKIYSEAELVAQIKKTPYGTPVDATFLIKGANFSRNDQRVAQTWKVSADCTNKNLSGGSASSEGGKAYCAESYHSTFTISQTIENVPNGKYQLTAQGFYRQDGTDNDNLPYFFLNDAKAPVLLKTGTENSMADAGASFLAGNYVMETPIEVVVTDGKLNLGIANPVNTSLWVIFDNFELTYLGVDLSTLETALANAREAAKVVIDANEKMNKDVYTALNTAYTNSETVERTAEAYQAAIDNLNNAVKAAKTSIAVYASIKKWYDDAKVNFTEEGYNSFLAETADIKTAYDNGTITDGVAENATLKTQYAEHMAKYYAPGADITDVYIKNARLLEGANGWNCNPARSGGDGLNDGKIGVLEFYAGWGSLEMTKFEMLQTISLPAGEYTLSSNAFFRYGVAFDTDKTKSEAYMVCGNDKTLLPTLGSIEGLGNYANSTSDAITVFEKGLYETSTTFKLLEASDVTVGYSGEFTLKQSWFISGPLKLTYVGPVSLEGYINDLKAVLAKVPESAMEKSLRQALIDAVTVAQVVLAKYNGDPTSVTAKEANDACEALKVAINNAEPSVKIYKGIKDAADKAQALDEDGQKKFDELIADVRTAYEEGTITDGVAELATINSALVEATKVQTTIGSDWSLLGSNKKDDWAGASGIYQTGVELYTGDSTPGDAKVLLSQTVEGLMPGAKYEVKFYAAANVARNLSAENYGDGIAYVFANNEKKDITVGQLKEGSFTTDEYLHTFVVEVGEDGKLEFGLGNKKVGGQWYVAQFVSLILIEPGIPTTWDFTTITASTTDGTGNLKNNIVEDDGSAWSNHQNNKAITDEELTISEGVPYAVTKGLKFTAGGSGWIHIRNYPEANYGKQFYSNNKDLMMTVPVKAGQYVIFTALSAKGALTLKAIEGTDTTALALCGHDKYVYKSKAGDVKFNLPKQMTIKKIEVVDEMPAGLWNFETLVPIKADGTGNLKNEIKDDGGTGWTNLQNSMAITDEELTIADGVPYNVTKGLKFTAGGSGWIHIRNYPEANGGQQFFSNNKDLKVMVPAMAGQYIVFDAFSASGTTQIVYGDNTIDVYPGGVSGYIVKATEDNPVINIKKQLTIKKIYVLDEAPYLLAANLKASVAATTVKVGDKSQITWTSDNTTTPIFTSSNEEVATVNAKGEISTLGAGEVTITVSQPANAFFNEATSTIKLTVENAGPTDLGLAIAEAVAGKAMGDTAVVTLDGKVAYTFEKPVDAGLVNIVVNGNGAVVTLSDSVQIAGMQGIEINEVNFICDANTKLAPIALSANPDSVLIGANYPVAEGATNNLRSKAFYNEGAIVINGCNFSGIHTSWISANKREWNLKTLKIVNTIAQFDVATGIDSYINWTGNSNNEGSIKDIVIENSTLYNIVESNDNYFLRYQNSSNSQPQKAWAEPQFDGMCSWTMTNNTFVNLPSNKNFANNYPNKKPLCDFTWTGNVFYNTTLLQKAVQSNVANFTAADNSIIGITKTVDATDASKYATIDSLLIIGEKPFVVPTTALDLSKEIDLKANFQPYGLSYAGQMGFGDPRWKAEVYEAGLALAEDSVEYINVRAKRANSWKFQGAGEAYQIAVATGNKTVPVVYSSSNEEVVKVDENGLATAVAPGSAIITMSQEPTAEFKPATLEMNVQVLPTPEYKKMYADAEMTYKGINLSDVLAPVTVGGKTFYQIVDSVASYVGYFDPTAPAQVQTSNRKMFIDYLTDNAISGGAAVASTDGTVTVAPIAGAVNTHTNPNVPKQMYFLVSNTDSVKFYYTGSSGSGTTVTMWVYNEAGEQIATVEGGTAAGKGTTSNTLFYQLPDKGNYKLALWGTAGDMELYYAKFFCDAETPTGINDVNAKRVVVFGEGMYDLSGRKVINPVKGNVYIINGKKYLYK